MGIGPQEGVLLGANLGRAIVTNGYFTAYVSDSAATRPSSQITLRRLVIITRKCGHVCDCVCLSVCVCVCVCVRVRVCLVRPLTFEILNLES